MGIEMQTQAPRNWTQGVIPTAAALGAAAAIANVVIMWKSQPKVTRVEALEQRVAEHDTRINGIEKAIQASENRLAALITGRETVKA